MLCSPYPQILLPLIYSSPTTGWVATRIATPTRDPSGVLPGGTGPTGIRDGWKTEGLQRPAPDSKGAYPASPGATAAQVDRGVESAKTQLKDLPGSPSIRTTPRLYFVAVRAHRKISFTSSPTARSRDHAEFSPPTAIRHRQMAREVGRSCPHSNGSICAANLSFRRPRGEEGGEEVHRRNLP
jgi:hypothetical protein